MGRMRWLAIARRLLPLVGLFSLVACAKSTVPGAIDSGSQRPVTEEVAEAADPASTTSEPTKTSSAPLTEEDYVGGFDTSGAITRTEELVFAPEETEKTIGGGTVAAGTLHEYLFTAPAGQELTVELQVEDNNAAFQIQDKSFVEPESFWSNSLSSYPAIAARRWSGMLPKSRGEQFRIVVGPTDDRDASYLMRIVKGANPSSQNVNNPENAASKQNADSTTSGTEAVGPASIPALHEQWSKETGLRYGEVRRRLMARGWIPHTIETTGPVRHYNPTGLLKKMYDLGYEEVVDCAGTGLAPCRFEFVYQDRSLDNGAVLAVTATVSSDPNPDPFFAGMNPDAYGVNTEYQNRSFDASLFEEIQQDERFCGAIGTCAVSSPYAVYEDQSQYAFEDAVIVARGYDEGGNRVVLFPRQPVSREQALDYAEILDIQNTIDLSDLNRELYNDDRSIESYAAPGEGPRNIIQLVLTSDGQVSEISFVKPGALL